MKFKMLSALAGLCALTLIGASAPTLAFGQDAPKPSFKRAERERHPEIRKAMRALRNAKSALEHADRDFGGHRAKALSAVDNALSECQEALKFDKK